MELTFEQRLEMRNQAISVFELTKGFTTEPVGNAMKTALEMANNVMVLTADLEIKKMYKVLFSFKKSYPEGGPPDWCEELVVMEAKGQDELNAKIAEYKNNDHCGYHKYIRLVNIIAL